MKKQMSVMLVAVVGLVLSTQGAMGNLLTNGGFESGLTGWGTVWYSSSDPATNAVARTGSKGLTLCHSPNLSSSVPGVYQAFTIGPEDTAFTVELWYKAYADPIKNTKLNIRVCENLWGVLGTQWFNGTQWTSISDSGFWQHTGSNEGGANIFPDRNSAQVQGDNSDTWQTISFTVPKLAGVTNYRLDLMADANEIYKWMRVDDVVITGVPEPAMLALVSLGGLGLLRRRSK